MTDLEYLIDLCKEPYSSPTDFHMRKALGRISESIYNQELSFEDVIEEIQKYVKDEDFISQCETYISHICEYLRIKG
ncbi:hypothetical protein [Barnesiella intestinihominis]|uniref:hypothetical protein n=1 Tax=Barnesiella intestinihominis TaxID=487174 RepID=UPI003AB3E7A3